MTMRPRQFLGTLEAYQLFTRAEQDLLKMLIKELGLEDYLMDAILDISNQLLWIPEAFLNDADYR